ncbi:MAG: hypothetical protein IMW91_05575 [Firmicutes bacterium]|nr:hypothetical protein [Bacillota bacterium]
MYLDVGSGVVLYEKEIVGIFDSNYFFTHNREFLNEKGTPSSVCRSVIVCRDGKCYFSPTTVATLLHHLQRTLQ